MNIYLTIKEEILKALNLAEDFAVETPKFEGQGDISVNIALLLSKKLGKKPTDIANEFIIPISKLDFCEKCEVAGAGFINIYLKREFILKAFSQSLDSNFGMNKSLGNGEKINIEYCSANPTGPVHIGHTRGTIFGDVLSELLSKNGFDVTREYYINDAGGQVETLLKSVFIRIRQLLGESIEIPEGCYPGEYLIPVAKNILEVFGEGVSADDLKVREFVMKKMMDDVKTDLQKLKVFHDVFTSEKAIIEAGEVEKAIKNLTVKNLIYKGILPQPKGKLTEEWEEREQTLFKSTLFGDSEDRALKKSDGTNTYFASDVAYHKNKLDRGFNNMILVLGADHLGYIKRITAATKALAQNPQSVNISVQACQIVKFVENGEPVKMSKRKGTFTTLADVLEEVGADILRFTMLTKKNDSQLEFDLAKVILQQKENPIFYIQYAYARGSSVLRSFQGSLDGVNLNLLKEKEELEIIHKILEYPKIIESAVSKFEPHIIANFVQTIAGLFHSFWNAGNGNQNLRFICEDEELTKARIFLLKSVLNVISSSFGIFKITPMEKM